MKNWTRPLIHVFNSSLVKSGNPNDMRKGEFVHTAPTPTCWANVNVTTPCIKPAEIITYSTGKDNTHVLCYAENQTTMTIYSLMICS